MHNIDIKFDYLRVVLCDLLFAAIVYYLPAIAHLTSLYIIEPFRLMILCTLIVLGSKSNAIVLAITLPLFSYLVSGHPVILKMMLISFELLFNILIFDYINKKIKNPVFSILFAVLISKAIYYLFKYFLILSGFLKMSVVSTSLWIQLLVATMTSLCFGCWLIKKTDRP